MSHASQFIDPTENVSIAGSHPAQSEQGSLREIALDIDDSQAQPDQLDDLPPQYDPRGRLVRTTPMKISRYDIPRRALTFHRPIPPGALDNGNDRQVPAGWHKMVHPEGQLYFYQPANRVVTEAYLYNPLVFVKITFWMDRVRQLASAQTVDLPPSSELFIELDEERDCCKYYLLDHASRALFWLDGGSTEELDLPAVSSDDHMSILMEEQYWNHVEFFPNHIKLSPGVEFEVRGMLTHTAADFFTSDLSTAPYTTEQCRNFLDLISGLPTTPETNAYKNCVMARLMAEFCSNRFVNHAGERSARLSRNQSLLEVPERQTNQLMVTLYALCFNLPGEHEKQLDSLWVDEISFSAHWRKFVQQRVFEWREQGCWGLGLAIVNAIFFLVPDHEEALMPLNAITMTSRAAGLVAEILSLGSILTILLLIRRHQPHTESHAMDASDYFDHAKHQKLGFQPLAVIYSIPAALLQWTFILTAIVLVTVPWRVGGGVVAFIATVSVFGIGVALYYIHRFFEGPLERDGAHGWPMGWSYFPWLRIRSGYTEIPSAEEIPAAVV